MNRHHTPEGCGVFHHVFGSRGLRPFLNAVTYLNWNISRFQAAAKTKSVDVRVAMHSLSKPWRLHDCYDGGKRCYSAIFSCSMLGKRNEQLPQCSSTLGNCDGRWWGSILQILFEWLREGAGPLGQLLAATCGPTCGGSNRPLMIWEPWDFWGHHLGTHIVMRITSNSTFH